MGGIKAIGAYVPRYRLSRHLLGETWGIGRGQGERAVAGHDEDTTTLAVEAALDTLPGATRADVDAVFFASTTATYREKMSAAVVATAADLRTETRTADFGGSLRAGTAALLAALDAVNAGSSRQILVVAADTRRGYPRSDYESTLGDGAAAVLVCGNAPAVEVSAHATCTREFLDVWRRDRDAFVRSSEERFALEHGYQEAISFAIKAVVQKSGLAKSDISRAAIYAPDGRTHAGIVRSLGLGAQAQVQDPLFSTVGNTGASHALLMLVGALEQAQPGERILFASYGDGADAFILEVKDPPLKGRALSGALRSRRSLPSYGRFLALTNTLEINPEPPLRVEPFAASTIEWREQRSSLRFHAGKCNNCGTVAHPIQRICYNCRATDNSSEVRLSDKQGTIFAITQDHLVGGIEPPTMNCVVETDEHACRVFSIVTDADPKEVAVGTRVEFTFRKLHEGGGFHNYYWKVRPVRA